MFWVSCVNNSVPEQDAISYGLGTSKYIKADPYLPETLCWLVCLLVLSRYIVTNKHNFVSSGCI